MAMAIAMLFCLNAHGQVVFNYDSAISKAQASGDIGMQAELNLEKGKDYFYRKGGGPEQGIGPYEESYRLYSIMKDSAGMANALNGMGVMYHKLGLNDTSLICYIQLVTIAEKKDYEEILGKGYLNMGILYQLNDELEKATHYLDLSLSINKKYGSNLIALALMNKGLVFHGKKDYDSALIKYQEVYNNYKDLVNSKMLADLFNNFGNLYMDWGKLDSAYYYFIKSKELFEELGAWYTFCQVYHNLALLAIEWGDYDQAIIMLDSSLVHAKNTGNIDLESLAYFNKHSAHIHLGNYIEALENYRLYDSLDKALYHIQKDKFMSDLEMKYQNEKGQAQNRILSMVILKKEKQSNIYLFSGIGFIGLGIFVFLFFRQRAIKDKIITRQRINQLEEEKKLLAAKYLVEGQEEERKRIAREIHDGLGVLLSTTRRQFSAIATSIPEAKPIIDKASKMLEQASNDARKISHNMMPGLLTKLGLYEAVADLFEKISETEGLKVLVSIPEGMERVPENKEIMIYRIIQEIVNNTLKHAAARNIIFRMEMQTNQLEIVYSDDGKGFNFEEKLESKSIGLRSIQSRINFLNGKMEIRSEPAKGSSFKFNVPC